ncbi:hypothetical protein PMI34_05434 [Pseudomonas sp. GM74]|uniref:hypothetical protein n=1 Tax=Pseudomonas sp. GM74 TaxID=1144336 RepID=UPI0002708442|nr:hypothetical protein [Pseudomonas sp. GM74]EJM80906.1 hypothetical protein PMI34_05434 [Pseudomonas sp. GM74]
MHLEQRLEFIDSLPTLDIQPKLSTLLQTRSFEEIQPPHDPDKPTGSAAPGTINAYLPGVPKDVIDDVDICKLVMQNAATKKFPKDEQLFEWYKYYVNGLSTLGWVIQNKHMQETKITKIGLTMDSVALEIARGLIGKDAALLAQVAKKALDAVKDNPRGIQVFDKDKHLGTQAKFDIAPVWLDSSGQPNMILNCISLDARESKQGILFWRSTKQSTDIKTGAVRAYLNLKAFSAVSNDLYTKFSASSKKLIVDLPDLDVDF